MEESQLHFIEYENQRDVLFVFGAGASIPDGGLQQKELFKKIFKNNYGASKPVSDVKQFIKENFYVSNNIYPSLESVFGYLDYFISKKESLGRKYSTHQITSIKETLIRLVHQSLSETNNNNGVYKSFWEVINDTNRNVSILTMNYDTLLDDAFDFLYPDRGIIDYCINFMNYQQYDKIDAFNWWDNPRNPITVWKGGDPKPIKIIKIHGSLNWKYCNCCNQVLLTPWDTQIDINTQRFIGRSGASGENPYEVEFDLKCPNDDTLFDTFIVPPSHLKDLNHPAISKLIDEAAIEIRNTKKIIFIGYSFPEADVHIKALFKKNISGKINIEVVDPFLSDKIKANYRSLSSNITFIDESFQNYIESHLEKKIKRKPNS